MKNKLDSFYLDYMGWIKTKTISRYCPFKEPAYVACRAGTTTWVIVPASQAT